MDTNLYLKIEEKLKGSIFKLHVFDDVIAIVERDDEFDIYLDFYDYEFYLDFLNLEFKRKIEYIDKNKTGLPENVYDNYKEMFSLLTPILFRKEKIKSLINDL